MKLLIDAQLPRRLALWLKAEGFDAVHTLDLPAANRTSDEEICAVADSEKRVVVTKDDDFVSSFLIKGQPERLLLVSTGNIGNNELLSIFETQLASVVKAFEEYSYVELTRKTLLGHE